MPDQTRKVSPGARQRTVVTAGGETLVVPTGWEVLRPGDASVTRKVKAAGPTWTMQEKKGRKVFSRGVWAPAENIKAALEAVAKQRQDPEYQRKLDNARSKRQADEVVYVGDFKEAILGALNFHPRYVKVAERMSILISDHATPVGSGTVARTKRIPIEERATAALFAWMRHKTSSYDNIAVPHVKGARRELRKKIAARSRQILVPYRSGKDVNTETCPLYRALTGGNRGYSKRTASK
jgi:hypothetical protein